MPILNNRLPLPSWAGLPISVPCVLFMHLKGYMDWRARRRRFERFAAKLRKRPTIGAAGGRAPKRPRIIRLRIHRADDGVPTPQPYRAGCAPLMPPTTATAFGSSYANAGPSRSSPTIRRESERIHSTPRPISCATSSNACSAGSRIGAVSLPDTTSWHATSKQPSTSPLSLPGGPIESGA
jgi:hypothetical protein